MSQIALYLSLKYRGEDVYLDTAFFEEHSSMHNGLEIFNIFKLLNKEEIILLKMKRKSLLKLKIRKLLKNIKILKYLKKKLDQKNKKNLNHEINMYEKIKRYDEYRENIKKIFNKRYKIKILKKENIFFVMGKYDEKVLKKTNEIHYITGCSHSEKYFLEIKKRLIKLYQFDTIDNKNKSILELILKTNSVSIHVRRGDYLSDPALGNLISKQYYIDAINYIKNKVNNPTYFIFSNDIEWCRQNLDLENCYYIDWNKGKESYRDMQLMSLCKHNIIPNSSFSWWGAWLNNNLEKIVVAPQRWINPKVQQSDIDIVPETWIKIRNY